MVLISNDQIIFDQILFLVYFFFNQLLVPSLQNWSQK